MTPDDAVYRPQDVDYLGFLEAQLRDLRGIDTLAYELIQNADDVKDAEGGAQTTWISFDVTDEALVVENDGVFRPVDFERLQNIASGGKRAEVGTTGSFGIGFIAVYQVTDAPEIFSAGRHWVIRPDEALERRIEERPVESEGTRFRLPWAFDERSAVRRALRIEAVRPRQLDEFARLIGEAVEVAALFLQQIQVLEVKRDGILVRRIERSAAGDGNIRLRQVEKGQTATWLLFEGEFDAEAAQLREQYPWQIEEKRRSDVRLALPVEGLDRHGRLFAVLPTETTTPLPFHINADFFPTSDRKRIHFNGGYQAEWNRAAIRCAGRIIAHKVGLISRQLGPSGLWHLLQRIAHARRMAEQGDLPPVFKTVWSEVAPLLKETPLVYTSDGRWLLPDEVRLLGGYLAKSSSVSLLEALQIPIAHPELAPYFDLMRGPEVGVVPLALEDVVQALEGMAPVRRTPLHEAPGFLRRTEDLQTLWDLIDGLLARQPQPQDRERALKEIGRFALVLTDNMMLERLHRVYRGKRETREQFADVAWAHDLVPTSSFPGRYVQEFGVRQAVEILGERPVDRLERDWRLGRLDLPGLFHWFESRQIEIFADDPSLQKEIRRLPLCPVDGELRPLAELYIPGGFEDPLRLAGIVNMEALGGRRQFLRDLGMEELTFDAYVREQLPRVLSKDPDLPSDALHRLVQLLAQRLGEIRDDEEVQERLSRLPLIACMDGSFRPATEVYSSRDVFSLLGERVHIAEPVSSEAVQALHKWLGVREEPSAEDVVQQLLDVAKEKGTGGEPLDASTARTVDNCWQKLQTYLDREQMGPAVLEQLRGQQVVPDRRNVLRQPGQLFFADSEHFAGLFGAKLQDHLLPPEVDTAGVLEVAGVQPLSQAVMPDLVDRPGREEDVRIQERIARRRPLVARILRAERERAEHGRVEHGRVERGRAENEGPEPQADLLDGLRVVRVDRLQMRYRLKAGAETFMSEPQEARVKLADGGGVLYVTYEDGQVPWPEIARELALAMRPGGPVAALALGIKEVLAAGTFDEAAHILDELGYPK